MWPLCWSRRVFNSPANDLGFNPNKWTVSKWLSPNGPTDPQNDDSLEPNLSSSESAQFISAVAGKDVKKMVNLIFIEDSHLRGALGAPHRVIHLISVYQHRRYRGGRVVCRSFGFLPPPPLPRFPHLLAFVAQHLVLLHRAVHDKHGSVLRTVLLMPERTQLGCVTLFKNTGSETVWQEVNAV